MVSHLRNIFLGRRVWRVLYNRKGKGKREKGKGTRKGKKGQKG